MRYLRHSLFTYAMIRELIDAGTEFRFVLTPLKSRQERIYYFVGRKKNGEELLMVSTGKLKPRTFQAHAAVRHWESIYPDDFWCRLPTKIDPDFEYIDDQEGGE